MEPVVATVSQLFHVVHAQLRDEVRGLNAEALNWAPGSETNSIAVLVVHTLGSEAQVLQTVAGIASARDRAAEFRVETDAADDLIRRLDAADTYLNEIAPRISAADLVAERPRGDMPPQTGLSWLLTNYGHAREHLAHIQLTKQIYAQQGPAS